MSKETAKQYIISLFNHFNVQVGEILMMGSIMALNNPENHSADDLNQALKELLDEGVIESSSHLSIKRLR